MAGQLTIDTLKASSGVLATQNGMTGIAKAWVNFSDTGSITINNQFNVSSVTLNASGDYTINFTTAMPNANFVASGMSKSTDTAGIRGAFMDFSANNTALATTYVRINVQYDNTNLRQSNPCTVVIFGT